MLICKISKQFSGRFNPGPAISKNPPQGESLPVLISSTSVTAAASVTAPMQQHFITVLGITCLSHGVQGSNCSQELARHAESMARLPCFLSVDSRKGSLCSSETLHPGSESRKVKEKSKHQIDLLLSTFCAKFCFSALSVQIRSPTSL